MKLFSIIVPVYNVEQYLSECIDSILAQSEKNYELILVDDGSTDTCPEICDKYAERNANICVVHKKNQGLVAARKTGLELSQGKYILNVDSDDFIEKDLLRTLKEFIEKYENPDVIAFDYQNVSEKGTKLDVVRNQAEEGAYYSKDLSKIRQTLLFNPTSKNSYDTGCIIYSIWSKAIKRELILKYQYNVPNELRNGEDVAVVMPTICAANSIVVVRYLGYYYRSRSESMVHKFNPREIENYLLLQKYMFGLNIALSKDNVDGYFFREVKLQYIRAARHFEKYNQFKKYIQKTKNSQIERIIGNCNLRYLSAKNKISSRLMRNDMWFIFWLMYR